VPETKIQNVSGTPSLFDNMISLIKRYGFFMLTVFLAALAKLGYDYLRTLSQRRGLSDRFESMRDGILAFSICWLILGAVVLAVILGKYQTYDEWRQKLSRTVKWLISGIEAVTALCFCIIFYAMFLSHSWAQFLLFWVTAVCASIISKFIRRKPGTAKKI
jgi:hypothetical protein